jgi:hypothetical protein
MCFASPSYNIAPALAVNAVVMFGPRDGIGGYARERNSSDKRDGTRILGHNSSLLKKCGTGYASDEFRVI